ncbi:type II toxin-antitoxin system RelE/ParE family toxin [Endozoicomonas sp. 4G]|uniref:type II toxin-antitoxin system RelE family toxin n=1 Tax=Endozoicomonas sp. 4G TaxID=2872754 RepID=UPI0032085659
MFEKRYTRRATKELAKIPEPDRSRIRRAVEKLPDGDIKKLQDEPGYRLRVGNWRIIYEIQHNQLIIEVVRVGPRGGIYKH